MNFLYDGIYDNVDIGSIDIYEKILKIKMSDDTTRYPYNIEDSIDFTQNELELYYKDEYKNVLSKSKKHHRGLTHPSRPEGGSAANQKKNIHDKTEDISIEVNAVLLFRY